MARLSTGALALVVGEQDTRAMPKCASVRSRRVRGGAGAHIYLGGCARRARRGCPPRRTERRGREWPQRVPATCSARHDPRVRSVSFEILRYLVQRSRSCCPPRWVKTESSRLVGQRPNTWWPSLAERDRRQNLDIGGPDIVRLRRLIRIMAGAGLRRRIIITLPVDARRFSTWWNQHDHAGSRRVVARWRRPHQPCGLPRTRSGAA